DRTRGSAQPRRLARRPRAEDPPRRRRGRADGRRVRRQQLLRTAVPTRGPFTWSMRDAAPASQAEWRPCVVATDLGTVDLRARCRDARVLPLTSPIVDAERLPSVFAPAR